MEFESFPLDVTCDRETLEVFLLECGTPLKAGTDYEVRDGCVFPLEGGRIKPPELRDDGTLVPGSTVRISYMAAPRESRVLAGLLQRQRLAQSELATINRLIEEQPCSGCGLPLEISYPLGCEACEGRFCDRGTCCDAYTDAIAGTLHFCAAHAPEVAAAMEEADG